MNEQLEAIDRDLRAASSRLASLVERTDEGAWSRRPGSGGWSAGECVAHLCLTTEAAVPPLRSAIERLESRGERSGTGYRRDVLGWLLWRSQRETTRMRTRTKPVFMPEKADSTADAIARFEAGQSELRELLRRSDGLALTREKMASPFDPRVQYNVYSAFTILAAHEHRHLGQAERAASATTPSR